MGERFSPGKETEFELKRFLTVILGAVIAFSAANVGAYAHHDESGHCEEKKWHCEEETEHCEGGPWHCVSHKSGNYGCAQYVAVTVSDGAEVYYTTDGTKPDNSDTLYTKPIYIACNTVLRTAAYVDGERVEGERTYIRIRAAKPCASAPSGEYNDSVTVYLYATEKDAEIYYTTDGSVPSPKSAHYTEPITVKEDTVLKFAACVEGKLKSPVVTRKYVITDKVYADAHRQEMFELVNSTRAEYGLSPLEELDVLSETAQQRAKECSSYFSHRRADGTRWSDLLAANGVSSDCRAENIAYYYETAAQALALWMNDSAHRDNILNPDMKYMGIGYCYSGGCPYWTQLFIG